MKKSNTVQYKDIARDRWIDKEIDRYQQDIKQISD